MDPAFKHLQALRGSNLVKETKNNITGGLLARNRWSCPVWSQPLSKIISRTEPAHHQKTPQRESVTWLGVALHSWEEGLADLTLPMQKSWSLPPDTSSVPSEEFWFSHFHNSPYWSSYKYLPDHSLVSRRLYTSPAPSKSTYPAVHPSWWPTDRLSINNLCIFLIETWLCSA